MSNLNIRFLDKLEYDKWDEFVDISPQGNIFNKSYWLNNVSDNLMILVAEENSKIVGGIALPFMSMKIYRMPKLTPQLGILLAPHSEKQKYSTSISREIEITSEIIKKLPHFNQMDYNFSYNLTNYMPFIWEDFDIKVKYTYLIEDLSDIDKVYSDFQYDVKYSIKKAAKKGISVSDNQDIEKFYEINKKTFERQGMQTPYNLEMLKKIDEELDKRNSRKILFGVNELGEYIAAVYLIYDKNCCYYLMGGADPQHRNSGVQTLLIWEAIKFASKVSRSFDFEGSMVKGIESSFRQFGGKQKMIFNVYKSNAIMEMLINTARKNKNIIRKFLKV